MKAKRIIACIISFILFTVCVPFTAVAEQEKTGTLKMCLGWNNWYRSKSIKFADIEYVTEITFINTYKYSVVTRAIGDYDIFRLWQESPKTINTGNYYSDPDEPANQIYMYIGENTSTKNDLVYKTNYKSFSCFSYKPEKGEILTYSSTFAENRPYVYDGSVLFSYDVILNTNGFSISDSQSINYIFECFGQDVIYIIPDNILNSVSEITYNNGTSAIRIKTDTDVSDIQEYIDKLEAENALLRQENTELKNRINLLATGTYGDVNGDQVVDVQDAQIILAYYTERDVAKKSVPDLVTFGLSFGKE